MASEWMQRLGLRYPVVQAGMGGGVADSGLVGAVSLAGGLGTLGIAAPAHFLEELRNIRKLCGDRPFAANLLMPFLRSAHVEACISEKPAVVVLFLGYDAALVRRLHDAGIVVWQQVGDAAQATRALADGADGLIAQGVEAGGHLSGEIPLAELLRELRPLIDQHHTLLAAGGIHDAATAHNACALGADGVVAGTRFLLTPESAAHPQYKDRLLAAGQTLRTKLFGLGWPAYHRVAVNAATARWSRQHADGPAWAQMIDTASSPLRRVLPLDAAAFFIGMQRLALPLYSPFPLTRGMNPRRIDTTPL